MVVNGLTKYEYQSAMRFVVVYLDADAVEFLLKTWKNDQEKTAYI